MNDFPDLYALVLRLRPVPGQPAPRPQGQGAQALFLDLVRQADPALSEELHADKQTKPFTVALLPQQPQGRRASEGAIELRTTFMRADLFSPVSHALLGQRVTPLRLGTTALELADVFGTPTYHPWAGFDTFRDLAGRAVPTAAVTMHFATPTAFGQGTRPDGKARLGLLPTPDIVFRSLMKRWNELAPADLHVDETVVDAASRETLVSQYHLESTTLNLGKGPQKGFVGRCTYELPPDRDHARILATLADAAFYLGLGIKTARGMGLCRRVG